jgi:hypothetical protein
MAKVEQGQILAVEKEEYPNSRTIMGLMRLYFEGMISDSKGLSREEKQFIYEFSRQSSSAAASFQVQKGIFEEFLIQKGVIIKEGEIEGAWLSEEVYWAGRSFKHQVVSMKEIALSQDQKYLRRMMDGLHDEIGSTHEPFSQVDQDIELTQAPEDDAS